MEYEFGAAVIAGACAVVLGMVSMRRHAELVLNVLLRAVGGILSIVLVNEALAAQNLAALVGVNFWTVLTSSILGLPGVLLLYGICLFKIL